MDSPRVTVYGTTWCVDCKRSKQFLGEQRVQYNWVDVEEDPEGLAFIEQVQNGGHFVPTTRFEDGSVLIEPTNAQLAEKLGVMTRAMCDYYDVIVVGGGPAGLTAALYTSREGLSTLVIDKAGMGGQAAVTERLDNYPGFPEGMSGAEFADRLTQQVRRFDVETDLGADRRGYCIEGSPASSRPRTAPSTRRKRCCWRRARRTAWRGGRAELIGSSMHFCATCDGPFYKGRDVAVIGGSNSAVEEGLFLTRFATKVTLLVRGPELKASQVALEKLAEQEIVDVLYHTEVVEVGGAPKLQAVTVRDRATESRSDWNLYPAGSSSSSGCSPIRMAPGRYQAERARLHGDVRDAGDEHAGCLRGGRRAQGSTKQAASAAGEGATAALGIRDYLHKLG